MANAINYVQGDSLQGTINLRQYNIANPNISVPFVAGGGATIEVHFPSATSCILSTANAGEITVTDANATDFTFLGSPTKGANVSTGSKQSIDVKVTTAGGVVTTFRAVAVLNVVAKDNP